MFAKTAWDVMKIMKYVNNAVINSAHTNTAAGAGEPDDMMRLIELIFFAYRDFVAAPDEILSRIGFGRAHHRVLHFVNRNPGLPVAELLKMLRITKQSLARVLKELLAQGFIEQRPGTRDRRQRLLHTTRKGRDLAVKLADLQAVRLRHALCLVGDDNRPAIEAFLLAIVEPSERELVRHYLNASATDSNGGAASAVHRP